MRVPFKVVVTDHRFKSVEQEQALIEGAGGTLVVGQCRTDEEVAELGWDADALLVARAPITARVIEQLERCRVIVRYGIGVDVVDVEAATRRGIMVATVPDYALDEVSDHALMLLLALTRRLPQAIELGQAKTWDTGRMPPVPRLRGRVLGLIGMGRIGSRLADKVRPLGVRTVVYDPYLAEEAAALAGVERADLQSLLDQADVVSLHAPLTPETRHLLGPKEFARMKSTAVVVNTARGGLIDQSALWAAVQSGQIAGAGLDVLEQEPPAEDEPLLHHPNVIVTAHVAWLSEEARRDLQRKAAEQVLSAMRGETPYGLVNRPAKVLGTA